MIFFWAVFDGLIAYMAPLYITGAGFTKTEMGLIIASANIFGAFFDFFISRFLGNTNYRRLFLILYALCSFFPLILWSSHSIFLFIFSMAIWGLYQDIQKFGAFDFISRQDNQKTHTHKFSILNIFKAFGYLTAPLIAGSLVIYFVTFIPFFIALCFLFASFIFYLVLIKLSHKHQNLTSVIQRPTDFIYEFKLWHKIGTILLPVLIFNTLLYAFDSTFWVLGPLFATSFHGFKDFGGIFMTAYTLPTIIVGWFIGQITRKYGKKRTAYFAFLVFNILVAFIGYINLPWVIISLVFVGSLIGSIAWPAIRGAYLDYINESRIFQKEITGLNDFSTNLGAIIGPALAGFLSDMVGIRYTFTLVGFINIIIIVILLFITPREIKVPTQVKC